MRSHTASRNRRRNSAGRGGHRRMVNMALRQPKTTTSSACSRPSMKRAGSALHTPSRIARRISRKWRLSSVMRSRISCGKALNCCRFITPLRPSGSGVGITLYRMPPARTRSGPLALLLLLDRDLPAIRFELVDPTGEGFRALLDEREALAHRFATGSRPTRGCRPAPSSPSLQLRIEAELKLLTAIARLRRWESQDGGA